MQCVNYFKQFTGKCCVPIRFSKHIPIGSYSNFIPYLILVFFTFRVEIMVHTTFLQQLFHMPIIKLFSLVCVQLFRIAHMIKSPPQGCGHLIASFPLDGNRKNQLRKTVYDGQDKSVARIISFQF